MKKINKLLPVLLTTTTIASITPIIASCNKGNNHSQELIDSWKAAWGKVSDYSENRNVFADAKLGILLETSELGKLEYSIPLVTYKSNSNASQLTLGKLFDRAGKGYSIYNFIQNNVYWVIRAKNTDPYPAKVVINPVMDKYYFEKYVSLFSIFTELYNSFDYSEENKLATWSIINLEDFIKLQMNVQFDDSKLIKQVKLAADLNVEEVPELGNIKGEVALTIDTDWSKQEVKVPAHNLVNYYDALNYDEGANCITSIQHSISLESEYFYTNADNKDDEHYEGINKIMCVDAKNWSTYNEIKDVNIIVNGKQLVLDQDYFFMRNGKWIKLATPLKKGEEIDIAVQYADDCDAVYFCLGKTFE